MIQAEQGFVEDIITRDRWRMPTPGRNTVLAVDDEPVELQFIALVLRRSGFEVIETTSGHEALSVLEARPEVTLVIADCRMPHMSGPQLLSRIAVRWPEIKLVATSGAPRPEGVPVQATFLQKPYRPTVLARHIEERLAVPVP